MVNISISREFIQDADNICNINSNSFRKLNWIIAPKEEGFISYRGKMFDLFVTDNKCEIPEKENQIVAFDEPLTSRDFENILIDMIDDMEEILLKERCPEEDLEEVDTDEYITKEEQYNIYIEAWFLAAQKIAEVILQRIRTYYELDDNAPIRVYADDTLLIATYRDVPVYTDLVHSMLTAKKQEDNGEFTEELKKRLWKEKEEAILDTKYSGIKPWKAVDIYDAIINNRKIKTGDMYWMMLLKYAENHIN
ncbi:MAG: hypothetical protein ACLUF4_04060 [Lachnospira eligens]|jgi:hypothetical protein